jgi:hypothetical protein
MLLMPVAANLRAFSVWRKRTRAIVAPAAFGYLTGLNRQPERIGSCKAGGVAGVRADP